MPGFSKFLAIPAMTVGVMLACAPAQAATINLALTSPAGPYSLANPTGFIPMTTIIGLPTRNTNQYNFTFTVSPGAYNLHTFMTAPVIVSGPFVNLQYSLFSGVPGSGLLLGTSTLGLTPVIDVAHISGGSYFLHVQAPGLVRFEEQVAGGIALSNAVPEPAIWATMTLGFGMLGLAARRRRAAGPATA